MDDKLFTKKEEANTPIKVMEVIIQAAAAKSENVAEKDVHGVGKPVLYRFGTYGRPRKL